MFPRIDQALDEEALQIVVQKSVNVSSREGAVAIFLNSQMLGFQTAADVLTPVSCVLFILENTLMMKNSSPSTISGMMPQ